MAFRRDAGLVLCESRHHHAGVGPAQRCTAAFLRELGASGGVVVRDEHVFFISDSYACFTRLALAQRRFQDDLELIDLYLLVLGSSHAFNCVRVS